MLHMEQQAQKRGRHARIAARGAGEDVPTRTLDSGGFTGGKSRGWHRYCQ